MAMLSAEPEDANILDEEDEELLKDTSAAEAKAPAAEAEAAAAAPKQKVAIKRNNEVKP